MLLIIQSAKKTLDIYNEEMNYDEVTTALKNAESRGVTVRIIMTYTTPDKPIFNDLTRENIRIHTFSGKKNLYIHAKVIVADGNYAYVGSQNFSFNSLNKNRELGIFLGDQKNVTSIENTFSKDWQDGKEFVVKN